MGLLTLVAAIAVLLTSEATGFGNVMNSRNAKVDQDKEASGVPEENMKLQPFPGSYCPTAYICPHDLDPRCGSDGRSYANQCSMDTEAECAAGHGISLTEVSFGPCEGGDPWDFERDDTKTAALTRLASLPRRHRRSEVKDSWTVVVRTGQDGLWIWNNAATDGKVEIQLGGPLGKTVWINLDNPGEDEFEEASSNTFKFETRSVGWFKQAWIRILGWDAWKCHWVRITWTHGKYTVYKDYTCGWIQNETVKLVETWEI